MPINSTNSSGTSSNDSKQIALLQLFSACVPLTQDTELSVSCVYATAEPPSSDPNVSQAVTLWLMSEPAGQSAAGSTVLPAGTAVPAGSTVLPGRALHIPVLQSSAAVGAGGGSCGDGGLGSSGSSSSSRGVVQMGPVVTPTGQVSDVQLLLTPAVATGSCARMLGDVHLLPLQPLAAAGEDAAAVATDPSSSSSSSTGGPSWLTPLPPEVGSWQWQCQKFTMNLPAGWVVTGIGVAVPVMAHPTNMVGQGQEQSSGFDVLAVLGHVSLDVM
jgi:hypothetical protein